MTTAIYGIVLMEPSTWSSGPLRLTHFCSVTVPAGVWAVQTTTGESPPPLSRHTFTKIDHHRAVVFGGYTGSSYLSWLNDTYVLDMETWVCRCMCLYILINYFFYFVHTVWLLGIKNGSIIIYSEGQLQREAMWVVG